jgi:hypothetical protein
VNDINRQGSLLSSFVEKLKNFVFFSDFPLLPFLSENVIISDINKIPELQPNSCSITSY